MIIIFFFVINHIIMREMPTVITQSPMSRFQIAQMYLIYYHVRPGKAAHQRSWKHETFGILPEKIMKRE